MVGYEEIEPDVGDNPEEVVEIVEARAKEEHQADEEEIVEGEEEKVNAGNQTRSGHIVNRPMRLIEEIKTVASDYQIKLSKSIKNATIKLCKRLVLYKVNLDVIVQDWDMVLSMQVKCMS